jgi:hypothetical protein
MAITFQVSPGERAPTPLPAPSKKVPRVIGRHDSRGKDAPGECVSGPTPVRAKGGVR